MTQNPLLVNTTAPLTNVALCRELLEWAINLPRHVDRMVCFSGYSGYGKTFAAAFTANTFRAHYIEILDTWTKKAFLTALANRMGVRTTVAGGKGKTALATSDILEGICEELVTSGRPLIIDDMHLIADRRMVETVRDIYKRSKAPILLIGEEGLPTKLKEWEAFDGRISKWQLAQKADWSDACHLRALYVRSPIQVADDLLQAVLERTKGSVRRIVNNLENIQEEARENGWDVVDLKLWGNRPIFIGQAPKRGGN